MFNNYATSKSSSPEIVCKRICSNVCHLCQLCDSTLMRRLNFAMLMKRKAKRLNNKRQECYLQTWKWHSSPGYCSSCGMTLVAAPAAFQPFAMFWSVRTRIPSGDSMFHQHRWNSNGSQKTWLIFHTPQNVYVAVISGKTNTVADEHTHEETSCPVTLVYHMFAAKM